MATNETTTPTSDTPRQTLLQSLIKQRSEGQCKASEARAAGDLEAERFWVESWSFYDRIIFIEQKRRPW